MQVVGQNNQFDCGIYVLHYITLLNQVSQILNYKNNYLLLKKDPDIIHKSLTTQHWISIRQNLEAQFFFRFMKINCMSTK